MSAPQRPGWRGARRVAALAVGVVAVLMALLAATPSLFASFADTTTNQGNQFSAASSFPTSTTTPGSTTTLPPTTTTPTTTAPTTTTTPTTTTPPTTTVPPGADEDFEDYPPGPLGEPWTVHTGTMVIGDGTASGASSGTSTATLNTNLSNIDATLTLRTDQPRDSGLLLHANSAGTSYFAVRVSHQQSGRVSIHKVVNGTSTQVAQAVQLGTPNEMLLRVTFFNGTYRVHYMGTQLYTYTMTPAELTAFGSNTRHGMITVADDRSALDNFTVQPYNGP